MSDWISSGTKTTGNLCNSNLDYNNGSEKLVCGSFSGASICNWICESYVRYYEEYNCCP